VVAAATSLTCAPVNPAAATAPGHGESKHVLVLSPTPWRNGEKSYCGPYLRNNPDYRRKYPDMEVAARVDLTTLPGNHVAPRLLTPIRL